MRFTVRLRLATAAAAAGVVCAVAGLSSAPPPGYRVTAVTITDLGTLGGRDGAARAVNNRGEIVGWSLNAAGARQAFLYRGGVMTGLLLPSGVLGSEAIDINNVSSIVGTFFLTSESQRGFVKRGADFLLLTRPPVDTRCLTSSFAHAISDSGIIVGAGMVVGPPALAATVCRPDTQAMRWSADLSPSFLSRRYPELMQVGFDINNDADVVGSISDLGSVPTIWSPAASDVRVPPPPSWARFPQRHGHAHSVAETGGITGRYSYSEWVDGAAMSIDQAFVYSPSTVSSTWLGLLASGRFSWGRGINEQGFVAGVGDTVTISPLPGPPSYRANAAFLWHRTMGLYQLPRLAASWPSGACEAFGLNDRNPDTGLVEVVGRCTTTAGASRAVRWGVTVR